MTNNTVPVIASGSWPFPPKYTATAIDAAAATNTATTAASGGLLTAIQQFYVDPGTGPVFNICHIR
jgi:hypothetical protein